MTFTGYAAVFDRWSADLGGFRERILPGAFEASLRTAAQRGGRMFLNHNDGILLGTVGAGTLRLSEDTRGLRVEADLPDTTAGRDVAELLRRGDVDAMSFGFRTVRDRWEGSNRDLIEAELWEVSPVTGWPAYRDTSASVRAFGGPTPAILAAIDALERGDFLTYEQRELLLGWVARKGPRPQ
jgi:HK97 family phage prohead protease